VDVRGATVVITGAASGIGRALADAFLSDGARVMAVDRDPGGLEELSGRGALTRMVDVSLPEQVESMVNAAVEATGRLDVLINNAGVGFFKRLTEHAPDEFEQLTRINLFGPYYGMRAAIPVMREQGCGRIINVVSRAAEAATEGMSAYGSSKAALFVLTRHAARETRGSGILVNGLIPGPTKTAMNPRGGQEPDVVYPTARMLVTFPDDGPSGRVFWNEKEYRLFDTANEAYGRL
jgi:NAD(P)-dependent dehydrogenase (short-subunit alcohol dehydrogenase family)